MSLETRLVEKAKRDRQDMLIDKVCNTLVIGGVVFWLYVLGTYFIGTVINVSQTTTGIDAIKRALAKGTWWVYPAVYFLIVTLIHQTNKLKN